MEQDLRAIRVGVAVFVGATVLSGITAFPLLTELQLLQPLFVPGAPLDRFYPPLGAWLRFVLSGYEVVYPAYPFVAYGTDWMAFAHLVIAGAFWGVWRDPVRNVWVVEWAMWACVAVIPLALFCGSIREIPWFWRIVDCSFGLGGLPLLWWIRQRIEHASLAAQLA